jgi:hypothetical protein
VLIDDARRHPPTPDPLPPDQPCPHSGRPGSPMDHAEDLVLLHAALERLPEPQRRVIEGRFLAGSSVARSPSTWAGRPGGSASPACAPWTSCTSC